MRPKIVAALLLFALALAAQQNPTLRAKQLLEWMINGDWKSVSAAYDAEFAAKVPGDQLKQSLAPALVQLGALKRLGPPSPVQDAGPFKVVIFPAEFAAAPVPMSFIVTLTHEGKLAGIFLRQDVPAKYEPAPYSDPRAFRNEEVTVVNGDWKLPGTLTLPRGKTKPPAVVLVHGSGPNDRDETAGTVKPFRDLAEGLASRGIAVLRYEKRTRVYGAKIDMKSFDIDQETTDDALAAVRFLRARDDIDGAHIFVVGHSQGGMMAPRIGERDPKIAGLVLLAGNSRPIEDLLLDQMGSRMKPTVERIKDPKLSPDTPAKDLPFGVPAGYWLHLRQYDQRATARKIHQPMLILQGEDDVQVTMKDFALWKQTLGERKNVQFRVYPKLGHAFNEGDHVAPAVIDDIARWIGE